MQKFFYFSAYTRETVSQSSEASNLHEQNLKKQVLG